MIHASAPGHPFTLGGENGFWPSAAAVNTAGRKSTGRISKVRSVPTTRSSGDLMSAPRLSADQKDCEVRITRMSGFTS